MKDKAKAFVVNLALMTVITGLLLRVIAWGGETFFIYAWFFVFLVSLALFALYHDFIAPLFDTFIPLPAGDLRNMIEALAAQVSIPCLKLTNRSLPSLGSSHTGYLPPPPPPCAAEVSVEAAVCD